MEINEEFEKTMSEIFQPILKKLERAEKLETLFNFLQTKMFVCPNFFEMRATMQKAYDETLHNHWTEYYNGFKVCDEITPKMIDLWREIIGGKTNEK